ncbi:MAG: hypothetical protein ACJ71N_05970 [Terriglobales bacterium]|jgi:hypothetical protein
MRSGLVFAASLKIPNRFLLCKVVCRSSQKLHRSGTSMCTTINNSFQMVEAQPEPAPSDPKRSAA